MWINCELTLNQPRIIYFATFLLMINIIFVAPQTWSSLPSGPKGKRTELHRELRERHHGNSRPSVLLVCCWCKAPSPLLWKPPERTAVFSTSLVKQTPVEKMMWRKRGPMPKMLMGLHLAFNWYTVHCHYKISLVQFNYRWKSKMLIMVFD